MKTLSITPWTPVPAKSYDLSVVIGRFQLEHIGHSILFDRAAKVSKNILILIGSSFQPRTIKNPLTFDERKEHVLKYMESRGFTKSHNITIQALTDNLYSDTSWLTQVQFWIENETKSIQSNHKSWSDRDVSRTGESFQTCIVGNKKDQSSYYLDLFPQYDSVYVDEFKLLLSSSDIRNIMFENPGAIEIVQNLVPAHVYEFIQNFLKTDLYKELSQEFQYYKDYRESWAGSPFSPVFMTKDFVIVKNGHILLVKRKDLPGRGLWALPGGFLKPRERIVGSTSEAFEETNIDVPPGLFAGSVTRSQIFDHPDRSLRGRVITHADLVMLDGRDHKPGLPKTRAGDDAKETKWFTFNEFLAMSEVMFEDHHSVGKIMLGLD